jgi:hypothetical protein
MLRQTRVLIKTHVRCRRNPNDEKSVNDVDSAIKDPSYVMVKLEYNHKGFNADLEDPTSFNLETLSVEEVIKMMLLLHLMPDLTIRLFRVCAYSQCVLAIEKVTKVVFATNILPRFRHAHQQILVAWQVVGATVASLANNAAAAAAALRGGNVSNSAVPGTVSILRKLQGERDVSLCTLQSLFPAANDISRLSFCMESASPDVCRRDYNPPCVWPHRDRIPFCFPAYDSAVAVDLASGESRKRAREAAAGAEPEEGNRDEADNDGDPHPQGLYGNSNSHVVDRWEHRASTCEFEVFIFRN